MVVCAVAEDGTAVSSPNPTAATATSATRLKVVFVDIIVLSIVAIETFSTAALKCVVRTNASLSPRTIRSTEETCVVIERFMK
ncbi:unannotated protein [freshwater metagenome]|uniref:Unannotated protein n=1 Tax=freshwater metagenome TaxID=449393 RepID=A0A6J7N8J6_9ZZZZ